MLGYIYALKDRGYDRGVKIGRDSHFPTRFQRAQCYSPRGLDLVAAWRIADGASSLAYTEAAARAGLPRVVRRNGGAEWRDLTAAEAIERISENLALDPEIVGENPRITATYDDFRDPKRLGREKHRQALWIYRENETGCLKVQRTSSWKVPLETVRTYSLLGFAPVAAFLHRAAGHRAGNRSIQDIWERLVDAHGYGAGHIQVGWLREGSALGTIRSEILSAGMVEVPRGQWGTVPPGLKPGY